MKLPIGIAAFVFCSSSILAQAPPGGTGPTGEWRIESVTKQGRYYGIGYQYVLGIPMEVPFELPWGSSTGNPQAVNSTSQPYTVWAKSEGKTIYKYRWHGIASPPSRVLVDMHASSRAWSSAGGEETASNGFGSPVEREDDWVRMIGSKKKVFDGSDGVFEVEIPTEAYASGSESAGVEQYSSTTVLLRGLTIGIADHEANYRKKPTGRMIRSRGGEYPEFVRELSLPEENAEGELFHIVHVGLNAVTRAYYDYNQPYKHIDAGAYAWGPHSPTEYFQWQTPMDNTSGSLPGFFGGGYEFGDAGVTNFYLPVRENNNTLTLNGANKVVDAYIFYKWSEGTTATSKVQVISHVLADQYKLFKSIDYTEDDQLTWNINRFKVLDSDPGWTKFQQVSLNCYLLKRDVLLQAGATLVATALAAGSEFIPHWPTQLACMAAGAGLALVLPEEEQHTFMESQAQFQQAIDNTSYWGIWIDPKPTGPIIPERMREYSWRVRALPLYQTEWYVCDIWGNSGFQRQEEHSSQWQKSVRYGYEFRAFASGGVGQ